MTGSAPDEHQAVLDAERAVNEQYRRKIDELIERTPRIAREIALTAGQVWTTSSLPRPGVDPGARSGIVGRVALEEGHPWRDELGASFYVAGWHIDEDGLETVNWAAPVASLFFKGRDAAVEPASSLLGRRSFVRCLDDIVDYDDEIEDGVDDPFARPARPLDIPAAPIRRPRQTVADQRPAAAASGALRDEDRADELDGPGRDERDDHGPHLPRVVDLRSRSGNGGPAGHGLARSPEGLRAENALLQVMEQPKTGRMGSILPTMQPDQYRLVSWPVRKPLIVQGQPGTGKTVVAAHRAAYVTSDERARESGGERVTRVAIVGPSERYVEHVGPIVAELQEPDTQVLVLSLPTFMAGIVGLPLPARPTAISWIETSWELGRVIDNFVRALRQRLDQRASMLRRVRHVVERLRNADETEVANAEIREWLRDLPPWPTVRSDGRLLPMLATAALALDPRPTRLPVGHLIVDEAQDVRPIEWRILSERLLAPGGQMSLFGDVHQRREDNTASSWEEIARDLELTDDAGHVPLEELNNGYRSTRQILRFANRLLPRGARGERALRDGLDPVVRRVPRAERNREVLEVAADMAARHEGLVAVIAVEPRPFSAEFRGRGWSRGHQRESWERDGMHVTVLRPDEARGLEFDAVVVVEPDEFPENVGRQGVLYTSLTRASKELAVVHSAPLPRDLRR